MYSTNVIAIENMYTMYRGVGSKIWGEIFITLGTVHKARDQRLLNKLAPQVYLAPQACYILRLSILPAALYNYLVPQAACGAT